MGNHVTFTVTFTFKLIVADYVFRNTVLILFVHQVRSSRSQWKQVFAWWHLESSTSSMQRYKEYTLNTQRLEQIMSHSGANCYLQHLLGYVPLYSSSLGKQSYSFGYTAVNCPLPKPPREGRIVHDKAVAGTTTHYGQGWTYECNPPKAPSFERGSCLADGTATEPPVCRG